jgi:signal transduction histidine kinase
MKLISRATLKLTALYTAVLLVVSISFSLLVGVMSSRELMRPVDRRGPLFNRELPDNVETIFRERADRVNSQIIIGLILTNLAVLIFGAVGCYFLARWTLKPIEQAINEQARFVSDASHELRTPLAVMQTENEVALRTKNLSQKTLTRQIKNNLVEVQKLRHLTDYLLAIGNGQALPLTEVDLMEVINQSIENMKSSADKKKITIERQISPVIVKTNPEALGQMVAILLENAVKYSPANSAITIKADASQIAVIDRGPGIAADDLPHIFKRFYRAERSRTSAGYGLGLSLAESLASQIKTKVTAANNLDGGATFTVRLRT